ncbi:acyltransferase family protein [Dyadobacter subterraneus]|uniref:Acyltransferase n=1 Tax=Dyadobacter subterraneus TaxID=2773304 RepID=A0ABR9WJZ5_9BACT|nr:acyltransferase [Dyadobacter subterraneus]MBE9465708.1 acyltransferase [Dyadobacter subterraneus]
MTKNYYPSKELIKTSEKIDIIQVLRGIAVVMVIIFHFKDIIKPGGYLRKELDFLFNSGAAGVDLFFVISGFIMVFVTRKSTGGIVYTKNFLLKRVLRIWPLYVVATLVYAIVAAPVIANISLTIVLQILKSIFFIPLSYLDPPYFGYAYLGVGWSLNYEMYFYLLIAISLLSGKYRWLVFAALIILTLVILPLSCENLTFRPMETQNYGSLFINLITNPIIWEFVYGTIIGLLYVTPSSSAIMHRIFKSRTIVITVIVAVMWQYISGFYGGHGPFYWGLSMALLFMALVFYNRGKSIKYPSWLIYLGDISFSVYLWHVPVAVFITNIFSSFSLPQFATGTPAFFLTVSLTLILSHISYQLLEKKMHSFFTAKLKM